MRDKIRQIVYEEYSNTLGIVAYKVLTKIIKKYMKNILIMQQRMSLFIHFQ